MRLFPLVMLVFALVLHLSPMSAHAAEATPEASREDADYLFRLGMLEGHLMVGHELLGAKQASLAMPHFGHPVRELYSDISDYLDSHKIPPFEKDLMALEASVASDPYGATTDKRYDDMIVTLRKARTVVPEKLRASLPEMIKVCANTVDAAAGEYSEAVEQGRIKSVVEYHDSRGYLSYVSQELKQLSPLEKTAADRELTKKFKTVFAKAQYIVEPLLPEEMPRASVSQYRSIAADAVNVANKTP